MFLLFGGVCIISSLTTALSVVRVLTISPVFVGSAGTKVPPTSQIGKLNQINNYHRLIVCFCKWKISIFKMTELAVQIQVNIISTCFDLNTPWINISQTFDGLFGSLMEGSILSTFKSHIFYWALYDITYAFELILIEKIITIEKILSYVHLCAKIN